MRRSLAASCLRLGWNAFCFDVRQTGVRDAGPDARRPVGKWIWQMAEEDTLPLDEIAHELACQYQRFIDVFGREPTHLDSHHHVHMFPQIFPIVARFAAQRGIALRIDRQTVLNADDLPSDLRSTQGFSSEFYGEEITEACFTHSGCLGASRRSLSGGDVSSGVCGQHYSPERLLLPPLN